MIIKLVNYQVYPDKLKIVQTAVRKFVKEVLKNEDETFYQAFQKKDSFEFVHIMKFKNTQAEKTHANALYTREFADILYPNCTIQPVFDDLKKV